MFCYKSAIINCTTALALYNKYITCTNTVHFGLLSHRFYHGCSIIPTRECQILPAQTPEGPSRHVRAYQFTVTCAQKGRRRQGRKRGCTQAVCRAKERGLRAIGILEMTNLGSTVSFILDLVLPRPKLTSLRGHWMAVIHRS